MSDTKKVVLVVGAPRQGKTYWSEKMANIFAKSGGTSIAYNVGMYRDFSDFKNTKLITPKEVFEMQRIRTGKKPDFVDNEIIIYQDVDTEKYFNCSDFSRINQGGKIKIERLASLKEERLFYNFIYKNIYNSLLILDDARAMTRNGMPREMCELFSRANHCGKKYTDNPGCNIISIYHDFGTVPGEMFFYCTHLVQFKTTMQPTRNNIDPLVYEKIQENYQKLKELPMYSRIETEVFSMKSHIFSPK